MIWKCPYFYDGGSKCNDPVTRWAKWEIEEGYPKGVFGCCEIHFATINGAAKKGWLIELTKQQAMAIVLSDK